MNDITHDNCPECGFEIANGHSLTCSKHVEKGWSGHDDRNEKCDKNKCADANHTPPCLACSCEADRIQADKDVAAGLIEQRIGLMRQWLNEDRIKEPKRFVTNEELMHWLNP